MADKLKPLIKTPFAQAGLSPSALGKQQTLPLFRTDVTSNANTALTPAISTLMSAAAPKLGGRTFDLPQRPFEVIKPRTMPTPQATPEADKTSDITKSPEMKTTSAFSALRLTGAHFLQQNLQGLSLLEQSGRYLINKGASLLGAKAPVITTEISQSYILPKTWAAMSGKNYDSYVAPKGDDVTASKIATGANVGIGLVGLVMLAKNAPKILRAGKNLITHSKAYGSYNAWKISYGEKMTALLRPNTAHGMELAYATINRTRGTKPLTQNILMMVSGKADERIKAMTLSKNIMSQGSSSLKNLPLMPFEEMLTPAGKDILNRHFDNIQTFYTRKRADAEDLNSLENAAQWVRSKLDQKHVTMPFKQSVHDYVLAIRNLERPKLENVEMPALFKEIPDAKKYIENIRSAYLEKDVEKIAANLDEVEKLLLRLPKQEQYGDVLKQRNELVEMLNSLKSWLGEEAPDKYRKYVAPNTASSGRQIYKSRRHS